MSSPSSREAVVTLLSSKRRVIAATAFVILLLFLVRPGASRLKSKVVYSISSAVGRSVDISSVHIRLLPWPGFDLENLVIYDDPAFGAEPMLRAGEVSASLRLISLLRGRLEVSRLDLTEPSLNLVQGQNGRWNVEALVERSAHIPLAPTAKAKSEPRFAFPYIEASSARINFKKGPEKKPYALTNADFSLWQESENSWGVRLKAQPIRSDLNLNDIGLVRVDGTWQRSATLRDTPLDFSLEWDRPQLGQLTKLFTGVDQGWRGGVQLETKLTGTPANLQIASDASIQDFRRYDITSGSSLRLAAHCIAKYSSIDHVFRDVDCSSPIGDGSIHVTGDAGFLGSQAYKLTFSAEKVPAQAAVRLAQLTKQNLPDDLVAGGLVHAAVSGERDSTGEFHLDGEGAIVDFRLASAANKAEIGPETVPFVLTSKPATNATLNAKTPRGLREGPRLEFGPFRLGPHSATVYGWVNRTEYSMSLTGEAAVAGTLRLAHMFGIPALPATPEGAAQVDLEISGLWGARPFGPSGFVGPQVIGVAKLHNVRISIRGMGGPIEISSGELRLNADNARIEKVAARLAGTVVTGSLATARGCGLPATCPIHFNLNAKSLDLSELRGWVSPRQATRPWYRILGADTSTVPQFLTALQASGRVTADHVLVRGFSADHVAANVNLTHGKLEVDALAADIFAARLRGTFQANFSVRPAECTISGNLAGLPLPALAAAMQDNWITGTANGSYQLKGVCGADFWQSAEGSLQFDIRDGAVPHISLAEDEGPLKVVQLSGQAKLHKGEIDLSDATLNTPGANFQVNGTATLQRVLDLKLTPVLPTAGTRYSITGPLADPRVAALPGAEQARLKSEPAK
jgi:hypothetical protein